MEMKDNHRQSDETSKKVGKKNGGTGQNKINRSCSPSTIIPPDGGKSNTLMVGEKSDGPFRTLRRISSKSLTPHYGLTPRRSMISK